MKITIELFVVRNKLTNEILYSRAIEKEYTKVSYHYPQQYMTEEDLKQYLISNFKEFDFDLEDELVAFNLSKFYWICDRAKDMPSIGNIVCSIETKEIEVE